MEISLISYGDDFAASQSFQSFPELLNARRAPGVTWINVVGWDEGVIKGLADEYHIHPLTVEDIMNEDQRPKVEQFDNYLFFIFKSIRMGPEDSIVIEQMSAILQGSTVLSFQQFPGDSFEGIRYRIVNNSGRIRRMGADYLVYLLLDAVIDAYFGVLDSVGGRIEDFEDRAVDEKDSEFIGDVQDAKRDLMRLRKAIGPLRESVAFLIKTDNELVSDELRPFLKDLNENVIQAQDALESSREMINSALQLSYSASAAHMNNVMRLLTIISTLFIPLTFIVGVYGMNFSYMPELGFRYGYPICWAVMVMIAGTMLLFFKRKKWF
jgi:magnesium transporter